MACSLACTARSISSTFPLVLVVVVVVEVGPSDSCCSMALARDIIRARLTLLYFLGRLRVSDSTDDDTELVSKDSTAADMCIRY
jgi:hypothetical protein